MHPQQGANERNKQVKEPHCQKRVRVPDPFMVKKTSTIKQINTRARLAIGQAMNAKCERPKKPRSAWLTSNNWQGA